MQPPITSLFITLRRSFAGTRDSQVKILKALGLRRREQTIEKPNNESIRGAINKVRHLISVETDEAYYARKAAEAADRAIREPMRVKHNPQS